MPARKPARRPLAAIVLAAGQGTRMKSATPKVLHQVCGTAMIDHVLAALAPLSPDRIFVVTGHQHEIVSAHVAKRAKSVLQEPRLGTGHAVMMVAPRLRGFDGDVLVLVGDAPLIRTETLADLVAARAASGSACAVLTTRLDNPGSYGRMVRNRDGSLRGIVEFKDCTIQEARIDEINTGTYCFDAKSLVRALKRVKNDNAQKEYYLTDTVEILNKEGHRVEGVICPDSTEVIGVNDRRDLAMAEGILRRRVLTRLMTDGVTVVDPATTFVDAAARISADVTLHPFTTICGDTQVGEGSQIGPHATLVCSRVGKDARVHHSVVEGARVGNGAVVGPFVHLKPEAEPTKPARKPRKK